MQWFYTAKKTFNCSKLCHIKWMMDEMLPSATSFCHRSLCGARMYMLSCKTMLNNIGKLFPFNWHEPTSTLDALSCDKNIHIQKCGELNELIITNTIHCEKLVFPDMLCNSFKENLIFFQSAVTGNKRIFKWSEFESSTSHQMWSILLNPMSTILHAAYFMVWCTFISAIAQCIKHI